MDANNLKGEYGNSNQNVPNVLNMSAIYNTPFGGSTWWKRALMKDWQISPSYSIQNGLPYTINISGSPSGQLHHTWSNGHVLPRFYRVSTVRAAHRVCRGTERNGYSLPRTQVINMRLSKRFDVAEKMKIELLGESFNLANHVNVTALNTTGLPSRGRGLFRRRHLRVEH